jgi:hypothetical protein
MMTNQDLSEGLVLLWQIAKEMATRSSDTPEECWLELMRAFWSGDFAPNGLVLWPTDVNVSEGEKFEGLTRSGLAQVALGSPKFNQLGAEAHWPIVHSNPLHGQGQGEP